MEQCSRQSSAVSVNTGGVGPRLSLEDQGR